jgi:LuxR family transcriptional regulator, maltose regulon positive regulatory protein
LTAVQAHPPTPGRRAQDPLGTLLVARTTSPQPSSRTLTRPRLLVALDEASRRPVTLVTGGPGTGKTQLLVDWVRSQPRSQPVAWVALGEDCNDPHRFWSLVLAAFQRVDGASDELRSMRPPADVDQIFVEQVVWALGGLESRVTIVLEDVHEVRSRAALEGLEHLIRSVPENLHVVLVARSDPPLAVHRLRVAGELGEIRQAALAFTRDEAAQLFAQHDLQLTDVELDQVLARTEGWAAGLRLAAMSLEGHDGAEERALAVSAFAGDTRAVADYLMTEVLERQPDHVREFLLLTSVVERIDARLADALVGGGRGAEALDTLERSGALLVSLDGRRGWYRYHRLFLEMCRHRLAVERPGVVADLHARAARWFSAHDEPLEALTHALESGDEDLFAWIAVSQAGALVFGHDGRAARALLRQARDDSDNASLWFACARALAYLDEGDHVELERRLTFAESLLTGLDPQVPRVPALVLALIRAATSRGAYDVQAASRHSAQALLLAQGLSATEVPALPRYVAFAHVLQGKSLIWSGQLAAAEMHLRQGRDLVTPALGVRQVDETTVLAGAYLSLVLAMKGELEAARVEASASLSVAADAGWADDIQSTSAHLSLALVYLQRSELAACELALDQAALVLDRKPDLLLGVSRSLAEVRLLALSGQEAAAAKALAAAREVVAGLPGVDLLSGWLSMVEAETALAAGRYVEVLELVDDAAGLGRVSDQGRVLSGRALLALGRTREALDVVAPVARDADSALVSVGAWLVIAEGEQELRRDAAAMASLDKALDRAAPEQLLRPFRESLTALRPLLERYLAGFGPHSALVESILGLEDQGSAVPVESLTDRELAVLQLLPTMMSNSEIAAELFVSVNTVKAHLKSLYRKLGVASRRDAVIQGRRLAPTPQLAVTEPTGSR